MTSAVPAPVPAPWQACLDAFAQELSPQQFATWIQPLACVHEGETVHSLRLCAPNRFVLQWVRERFGTRIQALASAAAGVPMQVE